MPGLTQVPEELTGILTDVQWQVLVRGDRITIDEWYIYLGFSGGSAQWPYLTVWKYEPTKMVRNLYGPHGRGDWPHIYAWIQLLVRNPDYIRSLFISGDSCLELTI